MADLTRDDILKLARLARLDVSEEEITSFQSELSEILDYVQQLQSVDTTGIEPTNQVTGLTNVTRKDTVIDYGYEPRVLLDNVLHVQEDQIKVKRMLG
jgi:aspartyl-tRNA(Asn)/glutamyl-tRNA(Gln) amidotransferase subunit C